MKYKRLSVLLSFVLVMMLSVSFVMPVNASSITEIYVGNVSVSYSLNGPTIFGSASSIDIPYSYEGWVDDHGDFFYYVDSKYSSFIDNTGVIDFFVSFVLPVYDLNGKSLVTIPSGSDTYRVYIPMNVTSSLEVSNPYTSLVSSHLYFVDASANIMGQEYSFISSSSSNDTNKVILDAFLDKSTDVPYTFHNGQISIKLHYQLYYKCSNSGNDFADSSSSFWFYPKFNVVIGDRVSSYGNFILQFLYYDSSAVLSEDIVDQTDTLTSGFDSSSMSSSNTALSGSIAEFTGAESQITDQSFGFIDQVQFYDLNMQPQLLACITFCSSWLQSLFVNIGDWGILVMVSLSLGFGLMLIGWFKYRRK